MNHEYLHDQGGQQGWRRRRSWRACHLQKAHTQKSPFEDKQQTPPWILHNQERRSCQSPHHALNAYHTEPEHWYCSSPPRTCPTHTSTAPEPPPGTDAAGASDPPWKKACRMKRETREESGHLEGLRTNYPTGGEKGDIENSKFSSSLPFFHCLSLLLCDVKETTVGGWGVDGVSGTTCWQSSQLLPHPSPLFLWACSLLIISHAEFSFLKFLESHLTILLKPVIDIMPDKNTSKLLSRNFLLFVIENSELQSGFLVFIWRD